MMLEQEGGLPPKAFAAARGGPRGGRGGRGMRGRGGMTGMGGGMMGAGGNSMGRGGAPRGEVIQCYGVCPVGAVSCRSAHCGHC